MRSLLTRALAALALLLCVASSARAIDVTVAGLSVEGYGYGGATATVRFYASQTFTASDGSIVVGGTVGSTTGFYKSITCSVSGTTLTCPSVALKSTTDALEGADTTYTAVLFDSRGTRRDSFPVSDFWLTHTAGANTTWAVIRQTMNSSSRPPANTGYPTNEQMLAAIAANNTVGNPATTSALGRVRLSRTPSDPTNPVVVEGGDLATILAPGIVQFAADGVSSSSRAVRADDSRLGGASPSTTAGLPSAGTAGRLRKLTDGARDVVVDTGTQWASLTGKVYDVVLFGAKGDGSTDDTTAFQAAITAAGAAGGGIVRVPPANVCYSVTALTVSSNYVRIVGAGWASRICKSTATGDTITFNNGNSGMTFLEDATRGGRIQHPPRVGEPYIMGTFGLQR